MFERELNRNLGGSRPVLFVCTSCDELPDGSQTGAWCAGGVGKGGHG